MFFCFVLSGVQRIIIIESRGGQRAMQLTPSKLHERPASMPVEQLKTTTSVMSLRKNTKKQNSI